MAITSELSWIPAGTPHHSMYIPPVRSPEASEDFGEWEEMGLLTAIVILAIAAKDIYSTVFGKRHPFNYLPEDPFAVHGVSQGSMYVGPGVVYYAE